MEAESPLAEAPEPKSPLSAGQALKDPVCGMTVTDQSPHRFEHAGNRYYFCSAGCKTKFSADPHKYLHKLTPPAPIRGEPAGTIYTCPMHPEIRRDQPGNCPICGMALEPLMPSLDEEENPELRDFSRRFWWTLPLTVIAVALAMAGTSFRPYRSGAAVMARARRFDACDFVGRLAVPRARRAIDRQPQSEHVDLDRTGRCGGVRLQRGRNGGAAALSGMPSSMHGRIGVYFEAAAVIVSLTLLGQMLELQGTLADFGRDQIAAGPRAENGAAHPRRWQRRRHSADPRARRRHAARPARRKSAGRRQGDRRRKRGRRVDAHRRADAGHQARRRSR